MLPLAPGEVHVWCADPTRVSAEALAALEQVLSPEERTRFAAFRVEAARTERIVTRALLRRTLSRYAPRAPTDWRFVEGPHGRLAIADGEPGFDFNVTHTPGLAAVAIARAQVGVDAESTERQVPLEIASRYFSASEVARLARMEHARACREFLRLWTLKEAYLKARGTGLSVPLSHMSFEATEGQVTAWFDPVLAEDEARWQFVSTAPTAAHLLAVAAVQDAPIVLRLEWPELGST